MDTRVNDLLKELNLQDKNEYQKTKGVYDYITSTVTYDHENLENDDYKLKYTAYAALINKTSICQGYATLLYRLLLELGVDCRVITGFAGGAHAWNIARIDDVYYNLDPTWDAGIYSYDFFLLPGIVFSDHYRNDEYTSSEFVKKYPMSLTPYVEKVSASGKLTDTIDWSIDEKTNVLSISGTGEMPDLYHNTIPWRNYEDNILGIKISEGITCIGNYTFDDYENVSFVELPSTLENIKYRAFAACTSLTEIDLPESLKTIHATAFDAASALNHIHFCGAPEITDHTLGENHFSYIYSATFEDVAFANKVVTDSYYADFFRYLRSIILPEGSTPDAPILDKYQTKTDIIYKGVKYTLYSDHTCRFKYVNFKSDTETVEYIYCTVCFARADLSSNLHKYVSTVVKPTCKNLGYTIHTCSICGDSYTDSYKESVGHAFGEWQSWPKPSCKQEGIETRWCYTCNLQEKKTMRISGDTNKILVSSSVNKNALANKTILCLGDGITSGIGVKEDETYHAIMGKELGANIKAEGVDGGVLCTGGPLPERFQYMTAEYLTENNIDVVTIFLGGNDWNYGVHGGIYQGMFKYDSSTTYYGLGEFGTNDTTTVYGATKMWCERIKELQSTAGCEDIQFIFVTPIITSQNNSVTNEKNWYQDKTNVFDFTLRQYCTAIMEICAYYEVPVLDLNMYSGLYYNNESDNNVDLFGGDGIHPGVNGHKMIADAFVDFLTKGFAYENKTIQNCGHSYCFLRFNSTCAYYGYDLYICTLCHYSYKEMFTTKPDHVYVAEYILKSTCTKKGYTIYKCYRCCQLYTEYDDIDPNNHSFDILRTISEPTCTEGGSKLTYCVRCLIEKIKEIPPLGHIYSSVAIYPPTCTTDGYFLYTCGRCGHSYKEINTPAKGHAMGDWVCEVKPLCNRLGIDTRYCDSCCYYETREVKKTSHSYLSSITPPTYTSGGYTTHTCVLCGESYKDSFTDPLPYLKGDINGDGKVNNLDAARLMQYIAGWDVEYVEAALDVNGDGNVNNLDAARLMQYIAGWDVEIN